MVIRLILLVLLSKLVAPACECGFLVRNPISPQEQLRFLDFLESDFTNHEISSDNQDWISQGFNVTADAGHGTYGKAFTPDNVDPHLGWPVNGGQQADDTHHRAKSNDGLELWVDSDVVEGNVISAEVDTARQDLVWGSYRAGIKVTTVTGTCSAFFWVSDNFQVTFRPSRRPAKRASLIVFSDGQVLTVTLAGGDSIVTTRKRLISSSSPGNSTGKKRSFRSIL